ncbi:IS3 family transposase [Streptomyces sp. ISL-111]|uniref:IS3 family transposase n=1 Tax=Streptomyces sp. ISL-111 TaxID=2819175 RepID=UPI001BEA0944|nr:IS3 family transposase [Streptomyces sp. ISL-111]MBT2380090.1 IS3 family transposase [Streptomyces sp. ISL-111]MBT2430363.1 IS3 family transposase [Streptomyces sp. ISL-112]
MDAEKACEDKPAGHSVAFLCRVLAVPRSTYYAHLSSRPARAVRERAEELLVDEIRVLHAGSRGAYGAPRIHAALRRAGRIVNGKRVERLMRVHHITGITRRRRRGLTRQARRAVFAADLIGRDFTAPRPGMRLVGDMTELITLEGKLYLATCIDLATREVVGWAMADHHRAALPVAALRMAAGRGGLEDGCVMHTDRGSEYTSAEFRSEIGKLRMRQSMGRVGSCYDNAAAESWFAVLKAEIGTVAWETREAARADVFHYIEVEYNRSRLRRHPDHGYVTPLETRTLLRQNLTPAA